MAFSPGSNKNIILVNTSNASQTIILPLLSDYPDRFLYVKDVTTLAPESTYSNYITIQTSSNDRFENNFASIQITSQFTNYTLYANPYTNCWNILNYYGNTFTQLESTVANLTSEFTGLYTSFYSIIPLLTPQQTSYEVDTIVDISYNTITYPFFNITTPLDPSPTINNPTGITTWSLTTSFNGLLSGPSMSIATYIKISNSDIYQDVSGNLFNAITPYMSYIPALTSGGSFPTRTTFTYKDTYNTSNILTSNNILSNGSHYSINMYVCIINDNNINASPYNFSNGNFEVSLTPIIPLDN